MEGKAVTGVTLKIELGLLRSHCKRGPRESFNRRGTVHGVGINVLLLQTRALVASYMGESKGVGECFSGFDPKCRSLNSGFGK